ncbi:hypothetical protein TKK_0009541 [Trichogramma kaykai]
MSAAGSFMPPMLVFPRANVNSELLKNKYPGSWAEFHKSGCMQEDIFTRWFKKFIHFSKASLDNPVLLMLDGHATRVKNFLVITLLTDCNPWMLDS